MPPNLQLFKYLLTQSEIVGSDNRNPITIDDPDKIFLIQQGAADLFWVDMPTDGTLADRHFLFRCDEQGLIMPLLGGDGLGSQFQVKVVGVGNCRIAILSADLFFGAIIDERWKKDAAALIDPWIVALNNALSRTIIPRPKAVNIPEDTDQFLFEPHIFYSAHHDIVWCSRLQNQALVLGLEYLISDREILFPLTPANWITVQQPTESSLFKTENILADSGLRYSIHTWHQLFISCFAMNLTIDLVDEINYLKNTAHFRSQLMKKSMSDLTTILDMPHPASAFHDNDSLKWAFSRVCQAAHIDVMIPKHFDSQKYENPLKALINSLDIRYRRIYADHDWWRFDHGPLLAFLKEDSRPVAIVPSSLGQYELCIQGELRAYRLTRVTAELLAPAMYQFYRTFSLQKIGIVELFKFSIRGFAHDFQLILGLGTLGGWLSVLTPFLFGIVYDHLIPSAERSQLLIVVLALILGGVSSAIFQIIRSMFMMRVEYVSDISLQTAIMDRILKLPAYFFRDYSAGNLATRANAINTIRQLAAGTTITTILNSLFAGYYFFLLYYYSPGLIGWSVFLILTGMLIRALFGWRQIKYMRATQELLQKHQGFIFQLINGIAKIRASNAHQNAFSVWAALFHRLRTEACQAAKIQNISGIFFALFPLLTSIVLFYQISRIYHSSELSTGIILAFITGFNILIASFLQIVASFQQLLQAIPLYESARPILETLPESTDEKMIIDHLNGEIEISHINFRYHPDFPVVLDDINLHIFPGEFVAFVGSSGSGKSTLFRLLLGFEKPVSGSIYYDGVDMEKIDTTSLRRQMGVVLQSSRLLSGSILDNLIGAAPDLTLEDALLAVKMAGLAEDIEKMPMGMQTLIMEGGGAFSGGQRQRLMIARAIIQRPRIILMDEATSALDNRTQEIVSESLAGLHCTRIVIAHRLSSIIKADKIFVMQNGRIIETGNYEQLMLNKGSFYKLAMRQQV